MTHRPPRIPSYFLSSWYGICHRNAWKWRHKWHNRNPDSKYHHSGNRHVRWKSDKKTLRGGNTSDHPNSLTLPYGSCDTDIRRDAISAYKTKRSIIYEMIFS